MRTAMESGNALCVHTGTRELYVYRCVVKLLLLCTLNEWTQLECKSAHSLMHA